MVPETQVLLLTCQLHPAVSAVVLASRTPIVCFVFLALQNLSTVLIFFFFSQHQLSSPLTPFFSHPASAVPLNFQPFTTKVSQSCTFWNGCHICLLRGFFCNRKAYYISATDKKFIALGVELLILLIHVTKVGSFLCISFLYFYYIFVFFLSSFFFSCTFNSLDCIIFLLLFIYLSNFYSHPPPTGNSGLHTKYIQQLI